jgi:integrase
MTTTLVLPEVADLRVFSAIADELSPATRKAYQTQLSLLRLFYADKGWVVFDTNPEVFVVHVLEYFTHQADSGLSLSTVNKTVSALRWEAGYTNPAYVGLLSSRPVKAFLTGVARQQKGRSVRKAKALTLPQLQAVHAHLLKQRGVKAVRDRALLALGVATALRSSSLGELTLGDIEKASTVDGLLVRVRFSKTDQLGEGQDIPVLRATSRVLDPVRAVDAWVKVMRSVGIVSPDAPLFPRIRKSVITQEAVSAPDMFVSGVLRAVLVDAGVVDGDAVDAYSSHSLRATFITLSAQAGVVESSIATVSGHKSMRVLRAYDRSGVERHGQVAYLGE